MNSTSLLLIIVCHGYLHTITWEELFELQVGLLFSYLLLLMLNSHTLTKLLYVHYSIFVVLAQ